MFSFLKAKPVDFVAPFGGKVINLDDVKDPVFSQRTIGDGYAVHFTEGNVYSPVDGEIIALFPTKHAIGIKSSDRNEYLIHIGLDTIKFEGKGFIQHVNLNDKVSKGQLLLEVNHRFFMENNVDMTSMVIITNLRGRRFNLLKHDFIREREDKIFCINN